MVDKRNEKMLGGYMTVEAAVVMFVVLMVYVFLVDAMIYQYNRCVKELQDARYAVQGQIERSSYEITELNPVVVLRLQRLVKDKGEEK